MTAFSYSILIFFKALNAICDKMCCKDGITLNTYLYSSVFSTEVPLKGIHKGGVLSLFIVYRRGFPSRVRDVLCYLEFRTDGAFSHRSYFNTFLSNSFMGRYGNPQRSSIDGTQISISHVGGHFKNMMAQWMFWYFVLFFVFHIKPTSDKSNENRRP